jgi:hypothetical protein
MSVSSHERVMCHGGWPSCLTAPSFGREELRWIVMGCVGRQGAVQAVFICEEVQDGGGFRRRRLWTGQPKAAGPLGAGFREQPGPEQPGPAGAGTGTRRHAPTQRTRRPSGLADPADSPTQRSALPTRRSALPGALSPTGSRRRREQPANAVGGGGGVGAAPLGALGEMLFSCFRRAEAYKGGTEAMPGAAVRTAIGGQS